MEAAIACLPDTRGKLFLSKLLKQEGPDSTRQFMQRINEKLRLKKQLTNDDFSESQFRILNTIPVLAMPRRKALERMIIATSVLAMGLHDTKDIRGHDRYAGTPLERQPLLGVVEVAGGTAGIGIAAIDDLIKRRLEAIAASVDQFMTNRAIEFNAPKR